MKIFLLIFSLFLIHPIIKQHSVDGIVKALNRGNAAQLSEFLDPGAELIFGDKKTIISKTEVEVAIREFFNANTVKNFEVLRLKTLNNQFSCCEGNLNTINGIYHTKINLKQSDADCVIVKIQFEK